MIRLAIIDDDQKLAKSLKSEMLEFGEIEWVVTSNSGLKYSKELDSMTLDKRPSVIIMDISMGIPDEGILATREIKSKYPDIEVVMFTVADDDDRIFEALKAGATGYLLKGESPTFIRKTINDVLGGGAQMSPGIARKAIRYLAQPLPAPSDEEKASLASLSDREREVLELVAKGQTYSQIADSLFLSTNTVKRHMMNIFGKLQVNNKIEALKKIHKSL